MRRGLLTVALLLTLATGAFGQTAPRIYWEHDGSNVTSFQYVLDGATAVSMGLPTPTATTYSYLVPSLTAGVHTLVIQACNASGCAPAAAITLVKL